MRCRQTGGWRADARFLSSSKRKVNCRPTVSRCPFLPILPLRAFFLASWGKGDEKKTGVSLCLCCSVRSARGREVVHHHHHRHHEVRRSK